MRHLFRVLCILGPFFLIQACGRDADSPNGPLGRLQPRGAGICPVADTLSVSTARDTPAKFQLPASDGDGDPLQYSIVLPPAHGTVILYTQTGEATFTPAAGYCGGDSFSFRVFDGTCYSDPATVTITIGPCNCPVADTLSVFTSPGTPVSFQLPGSDPDGDAIQYTLVQVPLHGTVVLQVASGEVTYTPASDFCGADSIRYWVNDGSCSSEPATVWLNVGPCHCPEAINSEVHTDADTPVSFQLQGSDTDGDPLEYVLTQPPAHGIVVLQVATGAVTYTPAAGYCGTDYFRFVVTDPYNCRSDEATVLITVCTADTDNDGLPDDQDACPQSDLNATIQIGDCDSGVTNLINGEAVNADGCSLADLVREALVAAAGSATNHGEFVQAAARALNRLARTRVLTPAQVGAIMSCVALADESDYQP